MIGFIFEVVITVLILIIAFDFGYNRGINK